ncbi:DNA-processing protein DprA [Zhihengliuella salsuginis]|uniref:DNA processing protein DprA n=1 Tax=Zhihengliuella salsuginis TaxID=578222 RepID=A0ABQ3GK48_9MICC|nr:DNA-processing protein DprA [Zhihengliuella salsuginis]GHD11915.1 DNA processing protein DprA [Zhihengliuella salsuginis]
MNSNPPDSRAARAALTRLIEPGDLTGSALVAVLGPTAALDLICGPEDRIPASLQQAVAETVGTGGTKALKVEAGLERWRPRVRDLAPARDLETMRRLGGGFLTPEDDHWPAKLDALGTAAPIGLWWRGRSESADLDAVRRRIAVVGSRDATEYGIRATHELVAPLVERGAQIVSGGAYGIDAAAHRAALASLTASSGRGQADPTMAVMAGGLDRFYPSGNDDLIRQVADHGIVLAEVAPGTSPTRWRFLQRNRLIAALCDVTVVVEARWRSGALTTARRAAEMGREVGAVPGSVFSANSAGCHRLIAEGAGRVVTRPEDVVEMAGGIERGPAPSASADGRAHDGLDIQDLLLYDALPVRTATTPDNLCRVAGLGIGAVLGGLSRLQSRGLAVQSRAGWTRGGAT